MYTKGECGCKIVGAFSWWDKDIIEYCPLHKAAKDMYEALIETTEALQSLVIKYGNGIMPEDAPVIQGAKQALAKAEGK